MAGAAPAYRYDHYDRYDNYDRYGRARVERTPEFQVVRGRGVQATPVHPQLVQLAMLCAVVFVALAVVCCVRIALTSATVTSGISVDELSAEISDLRTSNSDLEVRQSMLANSSTVRKQAEGLGMGNPTETTVVMLPEDVVQTDSTGALSLSKSLSVAASQAS